jgi:hypothetical protein
MTSSRHKNGKERLTNHREIGFRAMSLAKNKNRPRFPASGFVLR